MGMFDSIKDVAQYVPYVGPLIQAERNREQQQDVLNWQKDAQRTTWQREDTSVQRRVADLKSAGLSPVLAAGQGAQASSPINVTAPQKQIIDPLQQANLVMNLLTQKADIARSNAQKKLLDMQEAHAAAQTLSETMRMENIPAERQNILAQASDHLQSAAQKAWDTELARKTGTVTRPSIVGGTIRDLFTTFSSASNESDRRYRERGRDTPAGRRAAQRAKRNADMGTLFD